MVMKLVGGDGRGKPKGEWRDIGSGILHGLGSGDSVDIRTWYSWD